MVTAAAREALPPSRPKIDARPAVASEADACFARATEPEEEAEAAAAKALAEALPRGRRSPCGGAVGSCGRGGAVGFVGARAVALRSAGPWEAMPGAAMPGAAAAAALPWEAAACFTAAP
jgi:hypothetical protein